MFRDQLSSDWENSIVDYFEMFGDPREWYVYKETNKRTGEISWGVLSSVDEEASSGTSLFDCDSYDEARVVMAAFVFMYEIVVEGAIVVDVKSGFSSKTRNLGEA